LGYTVNVPTEYAGHHLLQWSDGYRTSTRNDAVDAGQFRAIGGVSLKIVAEQAALAPQTSIGLASGDGDRTTLIGPDSSGGGLWLDADGRRAASRTVSGAVRLFAKVDDPSGQ